MGLVRRDFGLIHAWMLLNQVRVWSVKSCLCISLMRYEASIISLAFHPAGEMLAVASGTQLRLVVWKASTPHGDLQPGNSSTDLHPSSLVVHSRNIRATLFHPSGDFLFLAAPDKPLSAGEMPSTLSRLLIIIILLIIILFNHSCNKIARLYCLSIATLLANAGEETVLAECKTLIPQVQYSICFSFELLLFVCLCSHLFG